MLAALSLRKQSIKAANLKSSQAFFPPFLHKQLKKLLSKWSGLKGDLLQDRQVCCLQEECMSALFSLEVLQAGAVKGLILTHKEPPYSCEDWPGTQCSGWRCAWCTARSTPSPTRWSPPAARTWTEGPGWPAPEWPPVALLVQQKWAFGQYAQYPVLSDRSTMCLHVPMSVCVFSFKSIVNVFTCATERVYVCVNVFVCVCVCERERECMWCCKFVTVDRTGIL